MINLARFGLFHGADAAGALRALGAPPAQLLPATVAFNAGILGGELSALAAICLIVLAVMRRLPAALSRSSARG